MVLSLVGSCLSFHVQLSHTHTEWSHFLLRSTHVRTEQHEAALNPLCTSEARPSGSQTPLSPLLKLLLMLQTNIKRNKSRRVVLGDISKQPDDELTCCAGHTSRSAGPRSSGTLHRSRTAHTTRWELGSPRKHTEEERSRSKCSLYKHHRRSLWVCVGVFAPFLFTETFPLFYMCRDGVSGSCMSTCEMSTARATVAFILSQRNSGEQLGSVGHRKLWRCRQRAFVCSRGICPWRWSLSQHTCSSTDRCLEHRP